MVQLITFIIFLVSTLAIIFVLFKKIPVLTSLPQNGHHGFKKHELILKVESKIKDYYFHLFSKQMLLHRVLSKFKLWVLKIEKRVDELLHGIRKKAQELDKDIKNKK